MEQQIEEWFYPGCDFALVVMTKNAVVMVNCRRLRSRVPGMVNRLKGRRLGSCYSILARACRRALGLGKEAVGWELTELN